MDPVRETTAIHLARALRVGRAAGLGRALGARALLALGPIALREGTGPNVIHTLHAAGAPGRTALVQGDERLGFAELDRRIDQAARALLWLGIGPGDRVALMMKNQVAFVEATYALFRLGASAVNVSYHLKAAELAYILDHSGSKALLFGDGQAEAALAVRGEVGTPEDAFLVVGDPAAAPDCRSWNELRASQPATRPRRPPRPGTGRRASNVETESDPEALNFVYTSGTTGKPKGAVRNMSKVGPVTVLRILEGLPFHRDDRHLIVCPLYHSGAQAFLHMCSSLGNEVHLLEQFDAERALVTMHEQRIQTCFLVPTMVQRILALPADVLERHRPRHLKALLFGAAPFLPDLRRKVLDYFGPVAYDFYGSTETGWITLATPRDLAERPDSVGRLIPGNEIRILDDDKVEVPRGEVGELFVRNAMSIEGYHDDPGATAGSRHGGFFSVGDLARVDREGYLYLAGRKVDMVISGGVNLYPAEVEECLVEHPGVEDAAVIGVPDDEWGEVLVAYVVRAGDGEPADEATLIAHCGANLARFKKPKAVRFVEDLPRNPTGKILKRDLRARWAAETG